MPKGRTGTSKAVDAGHGPTETHFLRELLRIQQLLAAGFFRRTGMASSRFALLRLLAVAPQGSSVTSLARRVGIDPAAVTRQLQAMEKEGLVTRTADPSDRRRTLLALSPKGEDVFAGIHRRGHELERRLEGCVPAHDLAVAVSALTAIRIQLERMDDE